MLMSVENDILNNINSNKVIDKLASKNKTLRNLLLF